jgi:uncharacterized pyridoxal phosphate-containing UPF0001 family protein
MVETVDSIQQAEKLNKAWFKNRISRNKIQTDNNLKIKIQVNTSQEKRKKIFHKKFTVVLKFLFSLALTLV